MFFPRSRVFMQMPPICPRPMLRSSMQSLTVSVHLMLSRLRLSSVLITVFLSGLLPSMTPILLSGLVLSKPMTACLIPSVRISLVQLPVRIILFLLRLLSLLRRLLKAIALYTPPAPLRQSSVVDVPALLPGIRVPLNLTPSCIP